MGLNDFFFQTHPFSGFTINCNAFIENISVDVIFKNIARKPFCQTLVMLSRPIDINLTILDSSNDRSLRPFSRYYLRPDVAPLGHFGDSGGVQKTFSGTFWVCFLLEVVLSSFAAMGWCTTSCEILCKSILNQTQKLNTLIK